jgi:pimeloyl-ACP methyl ester carboxylesterase
MAQAKPIIFIHGLFQGPFSPGVSQFLSPNPVSIPDLPGYGANRHVAPKAISPATCKNGQKPGGGRA